MSAETALNSKKQRGVMNPSASTSFAPASSSKRNQVYDIVNISLDVAANIAEGSDVLSPLKAACRTTKSILEVIQATENNQEEWNNLGLRLKEYMSALEDQVALFETYHGDGAVDKAFSQPLIHYVEFLEIMYDTVVDLKKKRSKTGIFTAFRKVKIDAGEILKLSRDIKDRHRQFMEALGLCTGIHVQAIKRDIKVTKGDMEVTKANVETILTEVDTAAILQLPIVAFVPSSVHRTCLEGTRKAVLQTIWQWADDKTSEKPIFWLCDIAGSGKSTVAMSAVEKWRGEGVLGGRFFFSIASNEGSTTDKFCSTIARDLVQYIPELAPHVAGAVKRNPSVIRSSIDEQFQTLVVYPICHQQRRVILVIDALDECRSGPQRRELVDTLSTAVRQNKNLRIFMTSRPDPVVQAVLGSLSIKAKLEDRLHDVRHRDNVDDIAVYVYQSLDDILSEDKKQRLVKKANGLFIWASTACRMLNSETSLSPPGIIYNRLMSMGQAGAMDDLYTLIFERTDPEYHAVMYQMLALLLAAFEPLTSDDLDDILKHAGVEGSAKAFVRNLGSVLTEDRTTKLIQFRHPTLVEFLRRCSITQGVDGHQKLHINIANAHGQVASWCLNRLKSRNEGLRFNICQIESSFYLNREIPNLDAKISEFISRRLRYASSHWLFHVAETTDNWRFTLKRELQSLIQVPHVLHWMEILSFIRGVPRAIAGLKAVTNTDLEEGAKNSMNEIRRFIIAFSVPIQDSAPHIYISALPFTPTKTNLHIGGIEKYIETLTVTQGLEKVYPGLPKTLEGHKGWINAVSFSPDGSKIVSGSSDKMIRLWDAYTGQPLGEPLRGHEDSVVAIAFSPDGSHIVSGSKDNTIRLWDAATGVPLGEPLQGHDGWVNAVIFSPDGSRIVSGSKDKTIRLWDVSTGHSLGEPIKGHKYSVRAVAFSPDGSRIVSGSEDKMICLWDAVTGESLGEPLKGHEYSVNTAVFSPDGSRIVSGSSDKKIRLWDAFTGEPLGEAIRGHNDVVNAVAFSPGGSQIVSVSSDGTLRLWDAATGQSSGEPISGHDDSVSSVAFDPNSSRIVSGSSDKTIRLWDASTGHSLGEPLGGHEYSVRAVAFSPDGLKIVSGSSDKTIRLWDAVTGESLGEPLSGHEYSVNAIMFSPDGSRVVSGSSDKTVRLWDAVTGEPFGEPINGHEDWIKAVAFSPDGSQIVSGSSDSTIRLWDAITGQSIGEPLRGHSDWVNSVAFSPDSSQIVSGSSDNTIRLWNTKNGQPLAAPLIGHENWVNAVAFSPDGLRIASGSSDNTIRLWENATGASLGEPLSGHEHWVNSIAFSPDGSIIVSGSEDKTVRLWSAVTGQPLGEPLRGHESSVWAVAFSPDGSRIVSGSSDKTVRLWEVGAGDAENTIQDDGESTLSDHSEDLPGTQLTINIPGFKQCSLLHDGWVQSSGKRLFWVPPDNRHGLQYSRLLLTMPTASSFRATKLDFTRFQCGLSWTKVRKETRV